MNKCEECFILWDSIVTHGEFKMISWITKDGMTAHAAIDGVGYPACENAPNKSEQNNY